MKGIIHLLGKLFKRKQKHECTQWKSLHKQACRIYFGHEGYFRFNGFARREEMIHCPSELEKGLAVLEECIECGKKRAYSVSMNGDISPINVDYYEFYCNYD